MARELARLNDRQVRTAKPKGKITQGANIGKARDTLMLCDGGGLYLQVTTGADKNIRRSWIFRYQRSKGVPVRDMGLGSLNDIGLAEAREIARQCRVLVKAGDDPIRERDSERARKLAASAVVMTFETAAETYIAQHRSGWKNQMHAAQWPASLKTYAYPIIGKMSVADIETPHVRKVLDPIWTELPETASRVRGRIEQVLGWATVGGFRKDDNGRDLPNPARWAGHLANALPSPAKVRKVKPQAALAYADVPTFVAELRGRQGMAALALEFTILTGVRTSDVRYGKRTHVDRAKQQWAIPEFTKSGKPHRVPLSKAALDLIDRAERMAREIGGAVAASELLFPSEFTGAALSVNAMLSVLARMGRKGAITTHGFRATFRTWLQEETNFPRELCELALGHKVGDDVEIAYARGDGLKKRVRLMEAWSAYCRQPKKADNVVSLRAAT